MLFFIFLVLRMQSSIFFFFFFNDTATTEIYTLSLHDALPICLIVWLKWTGGSEQLTRRRSSALSVRQTSGRWHCGPTLDRKSTRLNSSHSQISYAVFCLKKKKKRYASKPYRCSRSLVMRLTRH